MEGVLSYRLCGHQAIPWVLAPHPCACSRTATRETPASHIGRTSSHLSSSQKRSVAVAAGKKEGTMHTLADRKHFADFLQDIPAFASCTRNVLDEFVTHGVVKVRCGAGMTLSPHTDEDLNLYILAEGSALLSVGDDVVVTLEPGDYFGRTPSRRHHLAASVVALSDIEV